VAINVYSTLVTNPEVRGNAQLPRNELDSLMVEAILGWAKEIESAGFPEQHLKLFTRAVRFYEGESFRGVRSVEIVGLDEGLQRKIPVTNTFAEIIQTKQNS